MAHTVTCDLGRMPLILNRIVVRHVLVISILVSLLTSNTYAFPSANSPLKEYHGKLDSQLAIGQTLGVEKPMAAASEEDLRLLPEKPKAEDQVLLGTVPVTLKRQLRIALVRPQDGQPHLYADTSFDGKFDSNERHALLPLADIPDVEGATTVLLHTSQRPFASYPIRIAIMRGRHNPNTVLLASSSVSSMHAAMLMLMDATFSYPISSTSQPEFWILVMDGRVSTATVMVKSSKNLTHLNGGFAKMRSPYFESETVIFQPNLLI